jgi:glucose/arabinose dehydrogenase
MMRFKALIACAAALALVACSGGGGGPPPNSAPRFTSAATAQSPENTSASVYRATAADPDGQTPSFSIAGGADGLLFSIVSGTGDLSFRTAPDFEQPTDANRDNVYELTLQATDGQASATLDLRLTVTDVIGTLSVRRVASGLNEPLFLTALDDGSGRVLVVQKGGRILVLTPDTGTIAATPFIDILSTISVAGEGGLLGLALAADFRTSGVFYVTVTNAAGDIEIRRYRTLAGQLDRGDAATADVILVVPHPTYTNHNGGWLGFGPDGFLYAAFGDGGGAGDPDRNGQNPNTLLGAVVRIDPRTDGFPSDPNRDYVIPAGNPFAGGGGAPEIWVYGLRNPWRNSFDPQTGHLIMADVGQNAREEVNLARASDRGANFGWSILEGTAAFAGGSTAGLTPPVLEYPHGSGPLEGRSVTGGYVYRGPFAPLRGLYIFGDFVNRRIWSVPSTSLVQGATLQNTAFTDRTAQFTPDAGTIGLITSFGEDAAGNLYILDFDGDVFRLTVTE